MATLQNLNFNPLSISGCSLWVDAADRTSLGLSGTNVNQWNDKSGNGRNLTTTSGTVSYSNNRLSFPSGSIMSGPSMSFTGSIFLVVRPTANTGGLNMIIGQTNADKSIRYGATYTFAIPGDGNDIGENGAYVINGTQITVTNPALNTQNNIIYTPIVNGFTGTFTISNTFGSSTRVFIGDMYEIIMYTSALSNVQRQQVEGYLAWKWGMVANLPASHPYKLVAPNAAGLSFPSALTVPIPRQSFAPSSLPLVFGFLPTSITGCILWLDGMDTNSVTLSGNTVTAWRDKSATANNVTTVTGTPTYTSSGINLSRTSSDLMRTTNSINFVIGSTTIFYVAQVQTVGGIQDFMAFPDAGTVSIRYRDGLLTTVNDTSDFGNNIYYVNGTFNPTITTTSTYTSRHLVSAQNQYISGSTRATLSDTFLSRYTSGTYNEVIFFSAALTTAQRQQVEGYLAWKWGLVANLPANHPYKNIVPGFTVNVPIPLYALQGASFSPKSISGLTLWLDAADTSTLSLTGSSVAQWNDKSGNSRNAIGNLGSGTYSSNGFNSLPTIQITTTGNMKVAVPAGTFSSGIVVFVVFQKTGANTVSDTIITRALANSLPSPFDIYTNTGTTTRLLGNGTTYGIQNNATTIAQRTTPTIWSIRMFSASPTVWSECTNGIEAIYTIAPTGGSTNLVYGDTATEIYIGTRPDNYTKMNGNISEIITYNASTFSTTQRQNIEGYLAWKWGLAANLPATHPFKKYPPPPS